MADSAMALSTLSALHSPLTQAWAGRPAWRVLDARFDIGAHFLSVWQAWKTDPHAPRLLHYVALTAAPPTLEQLCTVGHLHPTFQALVDELKPHWQELLPGFHRLVLNEGRLLLTLCVGDLTQLLRDQQFEADAVFLSHAPNAHALSDDWNKWTVKALARCCQRGTLLALTSTAAVTATPLCAELKQVGFQFDESPLKGILWGTFSPHWPLKRSRTAFSLAAKTVGTCAVIGAGLAGASVAAALAKRGWQVQVLDASALPACGASGLPVGLIAAHVSKDDCAQSRLSRSGVRLMLQQAQQLLHSGQDWADTGVLEKQLAPQGLSHGDRQTEVLHAQAAWLKPAALVRAWLAQPGVQFVGNACVASLRKQGAQWQLLNAAGRELGRADRVVFANAGGALPLLASMEATHPSIEPAIHGLNLKRLPSVQGLRGLISWALHASAAASVNQHFPKLPVNGSGSVIPWVPLDALVGPGGEHGPAWFVGSSYQSDLEPERPDADNHRANLARLSQLLPELAQGLAPQFESGAVQQWKNTRCVTLDRLPLVGPLLEADGPSLWICAGMGSRGLSFSALCAELLAAQWHREPLPVSATLAKNLVALRGRGAPPPAHQN